MTIFSDWATGEGLTELRGRMQHFESRRGASSGSRQKRYNRFAFRKPTGR